MRASDNPALRAGTFTDLPSVGVERMTLPGTIGKTLLLLLICVTTAAWSWTRAIDVLDGGGGLPWLLLFLGSGIGGLVLGIVTAMRPQLAMITGPLYAACQGLLVGFVSVSAEQRFPGIVVQAVGLTFFVMLAMLVIYQTGVIKVTERFRLGVFAATGGIFLFYLAGFLLSLVGVRLPLLHEGGWLGITISLVVVVVAALNLVIDFDAIAKGVAGGAPKYMEWYGAFALMVTLIWLYFEILRLLGRTRR